MGKFSPRLVYRALDVAGRAPPNDEAAEQEFLGACFGAVEIIDAHADVIRRDEFYGDARGRLWDAMLALRVEGKPVDVPTVCARLRERDELHSVGGPEFVFAIARRELPDAELANAYAQTIRELAHRRRIAEAMQLQLGEAYSARGAHEAFVEGVESAVFAATKGFETSNEGVELSQLVTEEEQRLEEIAAGRVSSGGIPFGLRALDAKLGGGAEGETTIVAGRPGMGKTSLLRDIAVNVAASHHDGIARGVLVFSLEMTRKKFFHRMVSARANVNLKKIIAGKLEGIEAERAWEARDFLRTLPLVIDDAPGLTPARLRSRIRRAMMRYNSSRQRISLVAIDQLGWMRPDRQYGTDDRTREIGDILRAVVEICKETGVHSLVAAQLNREVSKRHGKDLRPRLTDIAESGHIEQHAHNIIAVHRPEYYESDKDKLSDEQRRLVEAIVLKQRDGATGIVRLEWDAECARFAEVRT